MFKRLSFSSSAILLTLLGVSVALLADSGRAGLVRRSPLSSPTSLQFMTGLLVPKKPTGEIERLSPGALAEFDLNHDGHLSPMESARGTASIRETRDTCDYYSQILDKLPLWLRRLTGDPDADDLR